MRCSYTRWQMSNAVDRSSGGGEALTQYLASGHAARCAACQAYGARLAALHAQLSRGALRAPPPAIAPRRASLQWLAAPSAAAAVIAVALAVGSGAPEPISPRATPAVSPVATNSPLGGVHRAADRIAQAVSTSALDAELHALIRDGQRGLDAVLDTGGLR